MQHISENNKRIAKNTLILYLRTLFILVVKLYTSRLILQYLGVEDYGIYNIVGSFITMFTIFNGALTTSIQRFLTYSLGEKDTKKVKEVFSVSLTILLSLSFLIALIAETIGIWYVNHKLNVPTERLFATNWVYQFTILTFILDVITVPYNSILTAYENFKAFAYFDILNTILTLILVLSIPYIPLDHLIWYGLGLLIIAIVIRYIYSFYCRKHYEASHFSMSYNKKLFKQLFVFSFYSFFGNMGSVIGEGGINIVINFFFGVTLNATRGISTQVSNAVGGFIRSFTTALNPQITKSYAEHDLIRCQELVFNSAKYSFLLLTLFLVPVIINIRYILTIWLTNIPPQSEIFIQLMLIQSLIHILFNPITTIVNATGNIKAYQIGTFIILISNIMFIYIIYQLGYPAYSGIIIQCAITFIQLLYSIYIMQKITGISGSLFLEKIVLPSFSIFLLTLFIAYTLKNWIIAINLHFIISIIASTIVSATMCFYLGLNKNNRNRIYKIITNKIKL